MIGDKLEAIEKDILERVNEFQQVDSSDSTRHGGSGLGLSICRGLAELMDGCIGIQSEPGKGSDFHFTAHLPVAQNTPDNAPSDHLFRVVPTVRKLSILVAEDNTVNQRILDVKLTRAGHQVTLAVDGQKAIDHWMQGSFDLIFMDVQMPELDGLEATRRIRVLESELARPRTVIIALTAHAMKSDLDRCIESGMDAYLGKPIDWQALEHTLGEYFPNLPASSSGIGFTSP